MTVQVICGGCGHSYQVHGSLLGRLATCKNCRQQFTLLAAPITGDSPGTATPVTRAPAATLAIDALLQESLAADSAVANTKRQLPLPKRGFGSFFRRTRSLTYWRGPTTTDRWCTGIGITLAVLAGVMLLLPLLGRALGILVFGAATPIVAIGLGVLTSLLLFYGLRHRMQVAATVAAGVCLLLLLLVFATHGATAELIAAREKASLDGSGDPYSIWNWSWEEAPRDDSADAFEDEEPEVVLSAEDNPSPWVNAGRIKTRGQPVLEHRKKLMEAKVKLMGLLGGVASAEDYLVKLPEIGAAESHINQLIKGKVTIGTQRASSEVARTLRQQENIIDAIDAEIDTMWLDIELELEKAGEKTLHADVKRRNQQRTTRR